MQPETALLCEDLPVRIRQVLTPPPPGRPQLTSSRAAVHETLSILSGVCENGRYTRSPRRKDPALDFACRQSCMEKAADAGSCNLSDPSPPTTVSAWISAMIYSVFAVSFLHSPAAISGVFAVVSAAISGAFVSDVTLRPSGAKL